MAERMNGRRVAVIAGCRTPFCKAGTALKDARSMDLARHATRELLERTELDPGAVDQMVFGQVVPSLLAPNLAREVSLLPQFRRDIPAVTINRACASANEAITLAHDQIALGHANVVIAGGAEALSDIPILASRPLSEILVAASRARTAFSCSGGSASSMSMKTRSGERSCIAITASAPSRCASAAALLETHAPCRVRARWRRRSRSTATRRTS